MYRLDHHVFFGSFGQVMNHSNDKVLVQNSVTSPLGGISLAGIVRGGIGVPVPNRILHRYSLVYVFQGSGFYTDDHVTDMPVSAGNIIQISPNTKHGYGPKKNLDWHEVYLIFEGPIFDVWFEQNCFELDQPVKELKPIDYWRDRFLAAIQPTNPEGEMSGIAEVLNVQALLLDVHKAFKENNLQNDTNWMDKAKQALATAASSELAAADLGMSYEAFRKKFRKHAGVPPARYHTGLIMEQACELLANSTHSVKEIAGLLDFCDEFHFSKRFSQMIGCSPTAYRARTYSTRAKTNEST